MTMLHTVNKSPFQNDSLESCVKHVKEGSAILLIEDGVLGAVKNSRVSEMVANAAKTIKVYALAPDMDARGIKGKVLDGIELVDYNGFVDLVAEYDSTTAWL